MLEAYNFEKNYKGQIVNSLISLFYSDFISCVKKILSKTLILFQIMRVNCVYFTEVSFKKLLYLYIGYKI